MSKSKVANRVTGLQEFLDSLSKPEMKKGGKFPDLNKDGKVTKADILMGRGVKPEMQMGGKQPESFGSRRIKTVSVSPDRNYKTIVREKMGPDGGSTSVTNRRTVKGLMGGAPKPTKMKNGGMSRMANEGFNNAKRTITDGYRGTGAPNPLRSIVRKNKYAMGGDFLPQNPLTASKYQKDTLMGQSLKKGGMVKKKKK